MKSYIKKIALKDLLPNPSRNLKRLKLNEGKIEKLMTSIELDTFWGGLHCRPSSGKKYELAFGHHRVEALKRLYGDNHKIDMTVREISDGSMFRLMVNENALQNEMTVEEIDFYINEAKLFLEGHPEIASGYGSLEKINKSMRHAGVTHIGGRMLFRFLNDTKKEDSEILNNKNNIIWGKARIRESLKRLSIIDSGLISEDVIHKFPNPTNATVFIKSITEKDEETGELKLLTSLNNDDVERFADMIIENNIGKRGIPLAIESLHNKHLYDKLDDSEKKKVKNVQKEKIQTANKLINELTNLLHQAGDKLYDLNELDANILSDSSVDEFSKMNFISKIRYVVNNGKTLLKKFNLDVDGNPDSDVFLSKPEFDASKLKLKNSIVEDVEFEVVK